MPVDAGVAPGAPYGIAFGLVAREKAPFAAEHVRTWGRVVSRRRGAVGRGVVAVNNHTDVGGGRAS